MRDGPAWTGIARGLWCKRWCNAVRRRDHKRIRRSGVHRASIVRPGAFWREWWACWRARPRAQNSVLHLMQRCGPSWPDSRSQMTVAVYYNSTRMHWVLYNAKLSAHGAYPVYGTPSFGEYPILTYPGQLGGYPRVWVSQGKHANYANLADCNAGGTLHIDTCNGNNTGARVDASAIYNLGSLTAHTAAQDCVTSRNPSYIYYGSGRKECYWTAVTGFRGWIPTTVGGAEADASYRSILNAQDFGT